MKKVVAFVIVFGFITCGLVLTNRMTVILRDTSSCYDKQAAFFQKYTLIIKNENWDQERKCVNHHEAVDLLLSCYEANTVKNGPLLTNITLNVTKLWKPEVSDALKDFNGGIVERHNTMCSRYSSTMI